MEKFICNTCGHESELQIEEMLSVGCSAYCNHCGQLNLIWNGMENKPSQKIFTN